MRGEAFLDVLGTQPPARPLPSGSGRGPRHPPGAGHAGAGRGLLAAALIPVAAMLAVLGLVAATGLSRRLGVPEAIAPYAYGFFLDRYPLFAFALIYGAARLIAVAAGPGPGGAARRIVVAAAGLVVLALAGLYPTFGGLILRAGFGIGGLTFLSGQPLWLSYALGSAIAAMLLAGILGVFGTAANRSLRPRLSWIGRAFLAFLALWFAAALIGLGRDLGVGPWPARAMNPAEAGLGACLLALAALPHAALAAMEGRRGSG